MPAQGCISDADLARLCDGDLTAEDKRALQQHLDTCRSCKARWDRVSSGERRLRALLSLTTQTSPDTECLSDDLIAGYISKALEPNEERSVEDHLARCPRCREQVQLTLDVPGAYKREGEQWWARYTGQEILALFARVPTSVGELAAAVQSTLKAPIPSREALTLPMLQPVRTARRLAAGTAEGFSEQIVRQEHPPFEFRLVQFGEEVRITARALDADLRYADCLARLVLTEGGASRLSRIIRIEHCEGHCILPPEEVRAAQPEKGPLTVTLSPLVALDDLTAAGAEAYLPILDGLLKHEDPTIRRHTVEVLTRIAGPSACRLLEAHKDDEDEGVRAAVHTALNLLPGE